MKNHPPIFSLTPIIFLLNSQLNLLSTHWFRKCLLKIIHVYSYDFIGPKTKIKEPTINLIVVLDFQLLMFSLFNIHVHVVLLYIFLKLYCNFNIQTFNKLSSRKSLIYKLPRNGFSSKWVVLIRLLVCNYMSPSKICCTSFWCFLQFARNKTRQTVIFFILFFYFFSDIIAYIMLQKACNSNI